MKILVTGGGGYIGLPLARRLRARNHQVILFDRFYFGRDLLGDLASDDQVEVVRGDIREIPAGIFQGVECVIDLAGLSNDPSADLDPALTKGINFDGAIRTAKLAKEAGVSRLIYSSSCSVYGQGEGILTEESPRVPVSLYAKMKVRAEDDLLAMRDDNFVVSALRNATLYGLAPRMRFDLVVNIMTLYAYQRNKIFVLGGGKQWRPLVHVEDVARAFQLVLDADAKKIQGEVFNVGSDEQNYQVATIARLVARDVPDTAVEQVPDDPDKRSYRVSFSKIQRVLGFEVEYGVSDGVKEVHSALIEGRVRDELRTKTVAYYKHLLEAERLVRDLALDGKML
ncbi:MAG: NAD-dependent epimerase/dehydratase family protein [Myxococcota bacterium]